MDDIDNNAQMTDEDEEAYIMRQLGIDADDEDNPVVEQAEEDADRAEAKPDKFSRKAESKLEAFEKKFDRTMLTQSLDRFMEKADDLEKGLMREISSDVKSLADFERAQKIVKMQADKLREKAKQFEEEAAKAAEEKAAAAWGTGTPGRGIPEPSDREKELLEKVNKGDSAAAFALLWDGGPH